MKVEQLEFQTKTKKKNNKREEKEKEEEETKKRKEKKTKLQFFCKFSSFIFLHKISMRRFCWIHKR